MRAPAASAAATSNPGPPSPSSLRTVDTRSRTASAGTGELGQLLISARRRVSRAILPQFPRRGVQVAYATDRWPLQEIGPHWAEKPAIDWDAMRVRERALSRALSG